METIVVSAPEVLLAMWIALDQLRLHSLYDLQS